MKSAVFILTLLFLVSCAGGPGAGDVRKMKSLIVKAEEQLDTIDTNRILTEADRLDVLLEGYRSEEYDDTLDLNFARTLDSALTEVRNLRAVLKMLPSLRSALDSDLKQVADLSKNIEEGRGTKTEHRKMYAALDKNVKALTNLVSRVSAKTNSGLRKLGEHIRTMQNSDLSD